MRSWITLPRQMHYVRISNLKPGEHTIAIEYNGESQAHKVTMKEGKIRVSYFSPANIGLAGNPEVFLQAPHN